MPIAINEEHKEMARVAKAFLAGKNSRAEARAQLVEKQDKLPAFWEELINLGWLGIHLPEEYGGSGAGLEELVLLSEEIGYAVAPGPFLPTVWTSALINKVAQPEDKASLLPTLANGEVIGAVGLGGNLTLDGSTVSGDAGLVLGAELASLLLLQVGDDVVAFSKDQQGISIAPQPPVDPSARVAQVSCEKATPKHTFKGAALSALTLGRTLAAAEASGGAHACMDMAVEYANVREQFGRTIASFQAVKHMCADMCVAAESATAAAWDAARAEDEDRQAEFAAAIAASVALPAFRFCGQTNAQVQGGIGYTWEHDAHLFIRRSMVLDAVFGSDSAKEDIAAMSMERVTRTYNIELPPEAEQFKEKVQAFIQDYKGVAEGEQRKFLSHSGYLVPHWPKPWGLDAGPIEQLVIDREFQAAGVKVPNLGISGWNTLTISQNGTPEQCERWIRQSLDGELEFCQLFSEPNAGSDAAAIQSKGVKVEGGWLVSGQKVWTSNAQDCNRGFMTVRTDSKAKKHEGITMMVVDMSAKGVDIRPLKQVTGLSHFNEVFFDEVFIPDSDVVGPVHGGWKVARATLGNEKVSIGGGLEYSKLFGVSLPRLLKKFKKEDKGFQREVAEQLAKITVTRLINLRAVARAVAGAEPGKEGNLTKLIGAEQGVETAALAARMTGQQTAAFAGEGGTPAFMVLGVRMATIAGGTSEILRNQIAERILEMPRDPLINN